MSRPKQNVFFFFLIILSNVSYILKLMWIPQESLEFDISGSNFRAEVSVTSSPLNSDAVFWELDT